MTNYDDLIRPGNWPLIHLGTIVGSVAWITKRLADALGADLNRLRAAARNVSYDDENGYYLTILGSVTVEFRGTYGGEFVGDVAA